MMVCRVAWILASILTLAVSAQAFEPMRPEQLQERLAAALPEARFTGISDEQFLRRLSLDVIGRQPTPDELTEFVQSTAPGKRGEWINRLLAHPDFGRHWANYWSDTIAWRVPPPELTFLNYDPFKNWLAGELNENTPWNEVVKEILSATGKVKDNPPVTFVAYHEAHAQRLAGETARVFLSIQIGCAQCHDHPFDDWKREQFHELAAFFVRASVKFPWNEGAETEVKDKGKGEYEMPNVSDPTRKGVEMVPTVLTGAKFEKGKGDVERRTELAQWVASADNPWFARAYVNRVWSKLMGRGFYEPVDDFGPANSSMLPQVHEALAEQFRDSNFNVKELFRLILNTPAYQQQLPLNPSAADEPFTAAVASKLNGDQVFAQLVTAIELPNVTPPKMAATKEIRFPPPPKSTRDLIAEAFAFDPSAKATEVTRTLQQAMLLMNQDQLQKQVNAKPGSGTALSKLLQADSDNRRVAERLFVLFYARQPTERELSIALEHVSSVGDRHAAFEDLLWSLINSAEFTTKR